MQKFEVRKMKSGRSDCCGEMKTANLRRENAKEKKEEIKV
jgi:hypothetical protein